MATTNGNDKHAARHDEAQLEMIDLDPRVTADVGAQADKASVEVVDSAFAHLGLWQCLKTFKWTTIFTVLVLTGGVFDGYCLTVPGLIAAIQSHIDAFGTVVDEDGLTQLNATYVSVWGGIQSAGQIVALITGGWTSDYFGRKFNLWYMSVLMVVSIILEIVQTNWIWFLFARLVAGWASGLAQSTITVYITEITHTNMRGFFLMAYSLFVAFGQTAGTISLRVVNTNGIIWRNVFYSEFVFVGIFIPALLFCPESPWFYAFKGKEEHAKRSLLKLNRGVEGYDIEYEYQVVRADTEKVKALREAGNSQSWWTLFRGTDGRRLWISFLPLGSQQMSGLALVLNNFAYFFSLAGLEDPFLPNLINNCVLIGSLIVATLVVNRVGRRKLLMGGQLVMGTCNIFLGMIASLSGDGDLIAYPAVITLGSVWMAAYSCSVGPLGWVYVASTARPLLRAKTAGFAAAGNAGLGLIFNFGTPLMISPQNAGWGLETGYFYGCTSYLAMMLAYFTIPETKNLTFAELDELFERRISARRFQQTETSLKAAEDRSRSLQPSDSIAC